MQPALGEYEETLTPHMNDGIQLHLSCNVEGIDEPFVLESYLKFKGSCKMEIENVIVWLYDEFKTYCYAKLSAKNAVVDKIIWDDSYRT